MQHTLGRPFRVAGVGLRGGLPAAVEVRPAPANTGRIFVVEGVSIPATVEHVVDTRLATTLGRKGARVSLVEHLCAALYAAGVDNAEIHVEGDEIPALDGSARLWGRAVRQAGLVAQGAPRRVLVLREPVEVRGDDAWARFDPADRFELDLTIAFDHPSIGTQRYAGAATGRSFFAELAWARTFGFFRDAEPLRVLGIARGVSLENTVVYDDAGIMNPEGLRAADEAVRHKALDAVGDAALLGVPVRGRFSAYRAGHALHLALLRRITESAAG
ncbi:MAG: UDP-3-O-acyl-N-acetylglucosamine deacetylase [Pseudomonadota bacterium]|nr:UDP-3-O-acyl-N-acetylglucosamine deacetylase [Pseudomonadota bacterium]